MRYTVRTSIVRVIGHIWIPAIVAAMDYTLSASDLANMEANMEAPITRESVEAWLATHAGDFQSVDDFEASLEIGDQTVNFPWKDEESELTYNDCMSGDQE